MIKIGIDPGPSSGCMVVKENDRWDIYPFKKYDYYTLNDELSGIKATGEKSMCIIEKVGSFPGSGKASNIKLVENMAIMKGLLIANKIPFMEKMAKSWMKFLPIKKLKTDTYEQWKKNLVQLARQQLPDLKFTNNDADAILMVLYMDNILF